MKATPGKYTLFNPYPGNTQIDITLDDKTTTFLVIENRYLDLTLRILQALGYSLDIEAQILGPLS